MSWKFGGIYFKQDYSADTDKLFVDIGYSYRYAKKSVSMAEAIKSSFAGAGVGIVNGNTMLHHNLIPYDCAFEPKQWYDLDKKLAMLSRDGDILCFFLDEMTSSYGLSLFRNGGRVRCHGVFNSFVALDEGDLLPGESEAGNETDRIFRIAEAFLNVSLVDLIHDNFHLLHYSPASS